MWSGGMGIINNRTCSFDMGRWDGRDDGADYYVR
jgi:hypothetical protein